MANEKISDLTNLGATPAADDLLVIVDDTASATKKVTFSDAIITGTTTFTNKTINDSTNDIHADDVHTFVRNASGSTITKGKCLYISGYNSGLDLPQVDLADATQSANAMPCVGIMDEDVANNASGHMLEIGRMNGIDTSSFSIGDILYVSVTAGDFSTAPTAKTDDVQPIAIVIRSHATLGVIEIVGPNHPHDTPNDIAIAKLADGTDGELITWDSSGVIAKVAVGTNDQVLKSNGAGAAPTFQDAGGAAGSTLLGSTTVTEAVSGSVSITPTGYKNLLVKIDRMSTTGGDGTTLLFNDVITGYVGRVIFNDNGTVGNRSLGTTSMEFNNAPGAGTNAASGEVWISDPDNSTAKTFTMHGQAAVRNYSGGGTCTMTADITKIVLRAATGSLDTGTVISVWGFK